MVAYVCGPSYLGGESKRISIQSSLGKVTMTLSQKQTLKTTTKGLGIWLK
jgi:hypothetical protein